MAGSITTEINGMDFVFDSSVRHKEPELSNKKEKKDVRITVVKVIVVVLSILLVFEFILNTVIIPCLVPVKIQFSGLNTVESSDLLNVMGQSANVTWMEFDSGKAVDAISSISAIEKVSVDKVFPDKVIITLKERIPVAKTIVYSNGRTNALQIDKNGVLFSLASSAAYSSTAIPLISGLDVDGMKEGMRFPSNVRSLMSQILEIQQSKPEYLSAVSEIHMVEKEQGNYELILYPINSHVRVLSDRALTEDTLYKMKIVLDVVERIEYDVYEVDLRYGSVTYKHKK